MRREQVLELVRWISGQWSIEEWAQDSEMREVFLRALLKMALPLNDARRILAEKRAREPWKKAAPADLLGPLEAAAESRLRIGAPDADAEAEELDRLRMADSVRFAEAVRAVRASGLRIPRHYMDAPDSFARVPSIRHALLAHLRASS